MFFSYNQLYYENYVRYNTYGDEQNDLELIQKEEEIADISDDYLNILNELYRLYH